MVPFYAAHAPGRMTWVAASFEQGNQSIYRIAKFYWVDEATRWSEEQLYQRAHGRSEGKRCWLGGLAKIDSRRSSERQLRYMLPNEDENTSPRRRKLVGLLLGSSGRPLNQLETDVDVLKCMYDLLESKKSIYSIFIYLTHISFSVATNERERRPPSGYKLWERTLLSRAFNRSRRQWNYKRLY